jgi:hypothetical protein
MKSARLSPPHSSRDNPLLPGAYSGNLARVLFGAPSASAGHLSFMSEQFKKLLRQITNAGGVSSFPPTSAGAASNRRALMSAKSRPHVIQVNHIAHVCVSLCETKFTTEAFS